MFQGDVEIISIHTPTKGATDQISVVRPEDTNFNPHSHEGSDPSLIYFSFYLIISIHTPTKGATEANATNVALFLFQSTLPRRERQQY